MRRVRIDRRHSTDMGTFGRLTTEGFSAFTGELPWRDNARGLSCIPAGVYRCVWARSPRLKRSTYRIMGVRDRSGVLFHSANLMGDKTRGFIAQVEGCIAIGEALGFIKGQAAVLRSMPAVRRFESIIPAGEPFELEIHDA